MLHILSFYVIHLFFKSFGCKINNNNFAHQNFCLLSLSYVYMKVPLVVAAFTMLVGIQTFFLDSLINTETSNLLDTPEEDDTCSSCPKVDAEDTEALCAEETETATIEGTTIKGEETCHQGTEDTTYTMN